MKNPPNSKSHTKLMAIQEIKINKITAKSLKKKYICYEIFISLNIDILNSIYSAQPDWKL